MSGVAMIRLAELRDVAGRPALPPGRDAAGWHQALTAEIAAHLTPAHAALLATPVRGESGTTWFAPGLALRRFTELPAEDRTRLTDAVRVILSDIRRLAESKAAPAVAAAWPALRVIPDLQHLFAVDGRPVLAGWGFAAPSGGAGPLAALDDGIAWRAPPRVAWRLYAGTLTTLAALALVVGLLFAPLSNAILPPQANACTAAPGQLALLLDQSREQARADALRTELAQLLEDHGTRALQCPIPRQEIPPPPPRPTPAPSPAPVPTPHADLPQDRWNQHDLAMLQGCWREDAQMALTDEVTHQINHVKTWTFCFDAQGHGHQAITLTNGDHCENNLSANFNNDNSLRLLDAAACQFRAGPLRHGQLTCQRQDDTQALCRRRDLEGPAAGQDQSGLFHRSDTPGDAPK